METQTITHAETFRIYDNIIVDIDGTLFVPPPSTKNLEFATKQAVYRVTNSRPFQAFECGDSDLETCIELTGKSHRMPIGEVRRLIELGMARDVNEEMLHTLQWLQQQQTHRLFLVSNIPICCFRRLRETNGQILAPLLENPKTHTLLASDIGQRMPSLGFFEKLLHSQSYGTIDPPRTLFVSRNTDNAITARSFGLHGRLSSAAHGESLHDCIRRLKVLCGNPLQRTYSFLRANAGNLHTITSDGTTLQDTFTQFVILDELRDESLVYVDKTAREYNFYFSTPSPPFKELPADCDTTSIAYTTLSRVRDAGDEAALNKLLDEMLEYCDTDGIVNTYMTHDRPRIDPVVCINVLTLFHMAGRGHEIRTCEDWVYNVMATRAYGVTGTRYYAAPEFFLYFLSRLLKKVPALRPRFQNVLRDRVLERMHAPTEDPLELAMRVAVAARCGVRDEIGLERLLMLQKEDGAWGAGKLSYVPSHDGWMHHQGLTVALAITAVKEFAAVGESEKELN